MERWAHQLAGVQEVLKRIAEGQRRICLTSPTGMGKTTMIADLVSAYLSTDSPTTVFTNRKLLLEQTGKVLGAFGLACGIRAAGHARSKEELLQISSIQTEASRVHKRKKWDIHKSELVIVDEVHCQTGPQTRRILNAHMEEGASIVGVTATPLGLGEMFDSLVIAGTTSEGRKCGALVPAHHYGPDEPDLKGIKAPLGQDLTEKQAVSAMMRPGIFGRVFEWWGKLNPAQAPTILFAPGVQESRWFAEQFWANGITAAHIDGGEVWINGKQQRTSREARAEALAGSESGDVKVICNRYVLREGIDCPWLAHAILATVFGSLQSYLQSGGRLLRSHPSLSSVTVQDHGGNWWRHGSLNADREWSLELDSAIVAGLREERLRGKRCQRCRERLQPDSAFCRACGQFNFVEPCRCPQCAEILIGTACRCGYEVPARARTRPVVQSDGTLKQMGGDIFRPRSISKRPDGPKIWERMYYRSKTEKGERTFRAAMALFAHENHYQWPDRDWPLMPRHELDLFRLVKDVPVERLT